MTGQATRGARLLAEMKKAFNSLSPNERRAVLDTLKDALTDFDDDERPPQFCDRQARAASY